jgi:hypothetical protein
VKKPAACVGGKRYRNPGKNGHAVMRNICCSAKMPQRLNSPENFYHHQINVSPYGCLGDLKKNMRKAGWMTDMISPLQPGQKCTKAISTYTASVISTNIMFLDVIHRLVFYRTPSSIFFKTQSFGDRIASVLR